MRTQLIRKWAESGLDLRSSRVGMFQKFAGDNAKKLVEKLGLEIDNPETLYKYKISDETTDRHGDVIRLPGWELDTFNKSGAVLFAHKNTEPPVQVAHKVWQEEDGLYALSERFEKGVNPFADMISDMVDRGYLKMTSVGFVPLEYKILDGHEDDWWPPLEFLKQDLTEYSIVPAGSNRNAFLEDLGEHEDTLKMFVSKILDNNGPDPLKPLAEEVHSEKSTKQSFIINKPEIEEDVKSWLTD